MSTKTNSALSQAEGLLKNLNENLSGENGFAWLANLKRFLRKENPDWSPRMNWPIWKICNVGFYASLQMIKNDFKQKGVTIYGRTEELIKSLNWERNSVNPYPKNFVMVSLQDLGFKDEEEIPYKKLIQKAKKMGLKECSPYDAPSIRLAYLEQEVDATIYDKTIVVTRILREHQLFQLVNSWGSLILGSIFVKKGISHFQGKEMKFIFSI